MKPDSRIGIVFLIDFMATREGVTGGTERQLAELVSHLDTKRFRPIVCCLQEFCKTSCWEGIGCEKQVLHVYSLSSVEGIRKFFSFVNFLKANSIDIVQTFFLDSTLFGITAARIAGVKNAVSCRRDLGFWYDTSAVRKLSLVNRITRRVLVNSEAVKESAARYEGLGPEKIDVILNGIDMHVIDTALSADLRSEFKEVEEHDSVVGMVGNFNREVKRMDLFIKAAAEIVKKDQHVKFLIIGGGKLENYLRKLIGELGLEGWVILAGKRESSAEYIRAFNIGVLSSDSEGFSNVILEYMAAGIPVVATSVGGNNEVIRNGEMGLLVPPGDHHALADAIMSLLKDADRRKAMGSHARDHILGNFAWEKKIKEVEAYYEALCMSQ